MIADELAAPEPPRRNHEPDDLAVLRAEFLATVSHELRTPLTSASSLLELITDDDQPQSTSAETMRALRRNIERLVTTVENLLLLARIEAGQLPLDRQPVETDALLGAMLDPLPTKHSPSDGPAARVLGDPYWLERMIRYLIPGTMTSGHPATPAVHGAVHNGYWTLTVSGDSLHTTAYRPTGAPDKEPGIGIGLGVILARAIATRHGGTLRIEHGATPTRIQITLPTI